MRQLFGFGQPIFTDLSIPGTLEDLVGADPALSAMTISVASDQPAADHPIYRRADDALVFAPSGIGQYRCRPASIGIVPEVGGDRKRLIDLLIATALPATGWMRGQFMLHAAAVVLPGQTGALAVSGVSGSGKSTVAAALLTRGASLVADDSVAVSPDGGQWRVAGLPGGLFQIDGSPAGRTFHPVPTGRAVREARLTGIVVLGERSATPAIRRLPGPEAVARLLAMQHRARVPAFLGRRRAVLDQAVAIARSIPVYLWTRRAGEITLGDEERTLLARCGAGG